MKTHKIFILAIVIPLLITIPSTDSSSSFTITVKTREQSYHINESIEVYGNLTYNGYPVQSALVALEVVDPNHDPVLLRTLQTNSYGVYGTVFRLGYGAKLGTYTLYVTSSGGEETVANSTTFELMPNKDIAVTSVKPSKNVIGQEYTMNITVQVENQGYFNETFNVTLYGNTTAIATQTIILTSENSKTIIFAWNATDFPKGNYTIWAYAWPLEDETDTLNNTCTGCSVFVGIIGDVNGNRKVDLDDVLAVAIAYGSNRGTDMQYWHQPPCPCGCPHSPNVDIDDNRKIDVSDYLWVAINYGKVGP